MRITSSEVKTLEILLAKARQTIENVSKELEYLKNKSEVVEIETVSAPLEVISDFKDRVRQKYVSTDYVLLKYGEKSQLVACTTDGKLHPIVDNDTGEEKYCMIVEVTKP